MVQEHKNLIIIDPGHGADDPGCVGPNGETEAALTTAIALELAGALQARGLEVQLTRFSNDYNPTKAERAEGSVGARLALSIHVDSAGERRAPSGAWLLYSPDVKGSLEFAAKLKKTIPQEWRGFVSARHPQPAERGSPYSPGAYWVLRHYECPAVLLECGFMSNPDDRARLHDPAARTRLVEALANAF
jgi:N-acetylmuramoyl-L-alanine amidase